MPLYGNVKYGSGETYGQPATLPFSVEPLNALALWYDKVLLTWSPSESNFTSFRLLRNQDAFPETSEDGIVLYEWTEGRGVAKATIPNSYVDGTPEDVALTPGKFIYYRVWLFDDTESWVVGGEVAIPLPQRFNELSPFAKTTHQKLMELLPKQFTSADASPNGTVDFDSELSAFLEGFSFSVDELLTDLSFLQPPFYGAFLNPATLVLQGNQLGVTPEIGTVTRQQKKTVREAMYIYQSKGTAGSISNFAESTTGYAPTIRISPNILLSIEDSSFYKGTGNWSTVGDAVLTSKATGNVPTNQPNACDLTYVGELEVNEPGARIVLGFLDPILYGIPVNFGTKYTFSYSVRAPGPEFVDVVPKINWYNYKGELLSTHTGNSVTVGGNWFRLSTTAFAPGYVGEITTFSIYEGVVTAYVSSPPPFQVGDSVVISESTDTFNGTKTISAVTDFSFSYTTSEPDAVYVVAPGKVQSVNWSYPTSAMYATVELIAESAGTLQIDMVQLADASVTDYSEARCAGIFLAPSKINYLKNPSFLDSGEAWDITAADDSYPPTDIEGVYGGLTMLQVTPLTSGVTKLETETDLNIPSAEFYSFSVFAKTASGPQDVTITMTALDVMALDPVLVTRSQVVTLTDIWSRPSVSFYLPEFENPLALKIQVKIEAEDATEVMYFEAAQLETSLSPTDYIDGSMPPSYGTGWYGTPHASPSFSYTNKESRLARLTSEIHKYIPFGGSYRVVTESDVELTEITY